MTSPGIETSRSKRLWIVLAGAAVLSAAGILVYWNASRRTAVVGSEGSTSKPALLCLAGSNTIAARLAPSLAQEFLKGMGASDVKLHPGTAEGEQIAEGVLPGTAVPSLVRVESREMTGAFDELGNGYCDIVMSTRPIKQDEITRLPAMGDMGSASNEHLLALDGIVVGVSSDNPVRVLSKEQVVGIFSGAISDWSQVGGVHRAINIYASNEKSETSESFGSLVLGDAQLVRTAKHIEEDSALSETVANDPAGIAFFSLAHVGKAQPVAVSERGATPLPPSRFTIATEDYPLSRRLYLYTPSNPANGNVRRFLQFVASKTGQDVVASAGFVPQNLMSQEQGVGPQNVPVEYQRLTRGGGRLSLDFRFLVGGSTLDNKATADINRVVDFVGDLGYGGNNILLFGFADSTGNPQTNLELSQQRARGVADELAKRGLKPGVVRGFGPYLPVADNNTAAGREKNRRVEIWVRR